MPQGYNSWSEVHKLRERITELEDQLEHERDRTTFLEEEAQFWKEDALSQWSQCTTLETWARDVVDTIKDSCHRKRGQALLDNESGSYPHPLPSSHSPPPPSRANDPPLNPPQRPL